MISYNKIDLIEIDKRVFIEISPEEFKYFYSRVNDYELKLNIISIKKIVFVSARYDNEYNHSGCNFFGPLLGIFAAERITENGGDFLNEMQEVSAYGRMIIKYSESENEEDKWESKDISWPRLNKYKVDKIINILKSYNQNIIIRYYL